MGTSETKILNAIEAIYEAATNSQNWPVALELIASLVESHTTVLSIHDVTRRRSEFNMSVGSDLSAVQLYEQYYHRLNPWFNASTPLNPGISPGEAQVPYQDLRRTEFFNDFGRPNGIVHTAGAILSMQGSTVSYLSLNRGDEMEMFSPAELERAKALIPHLKRALTISKELGFSEQIAEAWKHATVGLALFVGGRIERVNDQALKMLQSADGLKTKDGRFVIEDLILGSKLKSGQTLLISRTSGLRPYIISAIELANHRFMSRRPSILVLIKDPEQQDADVASRLAVVYGLTPAEGRLAALLIQGGGLTAAATDLGISRHTAKAQLGSIFSKTNTKTQAELVRVSLDILNWI